MNAGRTSPMRPGAARRRGAALIAALICVLLVSLLSTVLVKTALVQREQLEHDAWQSQAGWLAQSALDRSVARLAADAGYAGESWAPVTAKGQAIGRVVIEVLPASDGNPSARLLRATADVPDDPVHRARVVREWKLTAVNLSVSSSE